jgi:hypothetical protein
VKKPLATREQLNAGTIDMIVGPHWIPEDSTSVPTKLRLTIPMWMSTRYS